MEPVDLLGWLGVAFTFARMGSQPWHNLRRRRVDGVSVIALGNSVVGDVGWLVYGLAAGLPPVWVVAALVLPVGVASVVVARSLITIRSVAAVTAWSALLASSWILGGPIALGTVLVAGVAMSMVPQLLVVFRRSNLDGLSLVTVGLALADAAAWSAYGFATADGPLLFYGAVLATGSTLVGWRIVVTRRRTVTPVGAPTHAYTAAP
jgi:uncharacterized protein with PQ loop repeat